VGCRWQTTAEPEDQGNALWLLDKKDEVKEEYRRIQPSHTPIGCGAQRTLTGNPTNPEKFHNGQKEKSGSP
jgi:hypothetical protein